MEFRVGKTEQNKIMSLMAEEGCESGGTWSDGSVGVECCTVAVCFVRSE